MKSTNKQEDKKMDTKTKTIDNNTLEKVSGGNIFEDIKCFFEGHGYDIDGEKFPQGADYSIRKYKCYCCGDILYERHYNNGADGKSSKAEYDSY